MWLNGDSDWSLGFLSSRALTDIFRLTHLLNTVRQSVHLLPFRVQCSILLPTLSLLIYAQRSLVRQPP